MNEKKPLGLEDTIVTLKDLAVVDNKQQANYYNTQIMMVLILTMPKRFIKRLGYFHFWFAGTTDGNGVHAKFYGMGPTQVDKIKKHMVKYEDWFLPLLHMMLIEQRDKYKLETIKDIDFNWRWSI